MHSKGDPGWQRMGREWHPRNQVKNLFQGGPWKGDGMQVTDEIKELSYKITVTDRMWDASSRGVWAWYCYCQWQGLTAGVDGQGEKNHGKKESRLGRSGAKCGRGHPCKSPASMICCCVEVTSLNSVQYLWEWGSMKPIFSFSCKSKRLPQSKF